MEVGSRERYNCNICEKSYTDYNLYVKHCQYTHVKIETESSDHVVTKYTECIGGHRQTPITIYTEGIVERQPSPVDNIFATKSCNGHDLKMVDEIGTKMEDAITVSNSVSCGFQPDICDKFETKSASETENGVPLFHQVFNSMDCGAKSNNVNHDESSFISSGQQKVVCPENCPNSFIIKYEAEPKNWDLPLENKTQQDCEVNVKKSKSDRLSNGVELNVNLVKNEINFDRLACENCVSQESDFDRGKTRSDVDRGKTRSDVDRGKTRGLNSGLDFINSYSEGYGINQEDDDGELKTDVSEMKTDVSTKLINCNKRLCIKLPRIDYLLQDGVFTSSLMLPSDRVTQGLEEHFEIKIERDEEADFDVPIDDMAAGTDVISNIKIEDGCEPLAKLESVETEREEDLQEIQSKCFICYKKFANRSGMFRHLREVHKGMSKDDWEIYCEIKIKEKLKCRTCQICNTVFDTYQENKRHKLKHVQVKAFQCHVCGELFRQRQTMLNHVFRHSGVKKFQCEHCPITTYTKSQMKVHMRTHTKEKRFKCEHCTSRFSSNEMLKIHLRSHTGEKPFECDVCRKAFVSATALKVHSAIHTGVKKFQCQVCNKLFSQNIHLKTHARVHTGERPYTCTECDQKFGRKHHLDNHMRKHTGEKPYRCTVCHQTFALKQYLVSHLRVHTGEKPYKCPVCHVGFSQYTEQKVHTKRHLKSDYVTPSRKQKKRRSARVKTTVLQYVDDLDE